MRITSSGAPSARSNRSSGWARALGAAAALGVGAGLGASASAAPVRWETSQGGNGNSYDVVINNANDWEGARAAAQAAGGDLAVITSEAEQTFVQSVMNANGAVTGSYWFGIRETATEGVYENVTGEPLAYQNWNPAEPNNASGAENRGAILWSSADLANDPLYGPRRGRWNDEPASGYPAEGLVSPTELDVFRGGYLVEFAAAGGGDDGGGTAVPIPAAALTFPLGAAFAGVFYRRMRRGRSS